MDHPDCGLQMFLGYRSHAVRPLLPCVLIPANRNEATKLATSVSSVNQIVAGKIYPERTREVMQMHAWLPNLGPAVTGVSARPETIFCKRLSMLDPFSPIWLRQAQLPAGKIHTLL